MTVLEVCMYSGAAMWDPKVELPPVVSELLMKRIGKLSNKVESNQIGLGLGADNYMVVFNSRLDIMGNIFNTVIDFNIEVSLVYSRPGKVFLFHKKENTYGLHCYQDDQNIHSLLSDYAIPAIIEHNEAAVKQMENYFSFNDWFLTFPQF